MTRTAMRQCLHQAMAGASALVFTSCTDAETAVVSRPDAVPRYAVFEQTTAWSSGGYTNPWEQVTQTITLTSPTNRSVSVSGFYYAPYTWKARFAPDELGDWSWQTVITDGRSTGRSAGRFTVVQSNRPGFVRRNPSNPFRWVFDNGTAYNPIGIGDCILDNNHNGSLIDEWGLDGGFRSAGEHEGQTVDIDRYLEKYSDAGVNLFRRSVDNCSFGLYQSLGATGNVYLAREGLAGDTLVRKLRQYGFRTYMVIFGFNPPGAGHDTTHSAHVSVGATHQNRESASQAATATKLTDFDAIKRYVRYVVDRYGAYVDFWELMNEATVSADWYPEVATYPRSIDPYQHPISTSWEKPGLDVIEVNSPHWYETESEFESDRITWDRFTRLAGPHGGSPWKTANKPAIVGEQGNSGQNWDDRSALRMRLRSWTAFFSGGALIFWNSSGAKDYRNAAAAIYLGPEARGYLKVLQDFTRSFDPSAVVANIEVSDPGRVRAYGLSSPTTAAAYLHAYTGHVNPTAGVTVTVDVRAAGTATWIEPATGRVLGCQPVPVRRRDLVVPSFITDIALKIS